MLKPLGAMKYYWENKKKALLILVIFFLTVISISFISSLTNSAFVSAENVMVKPLSKMSIAAAPDGKYFLSDETVTKIEDFESVKKAVPVHMENTSYTSLMGNSSAYLFFTDYPLSEIIAEFGLRIKNGRLPDAGAYELAMHEDVLRNKGLKVGDEFGNSVDEKEWVIGRYKIVGSLSGDYMLSLGTKSYATVALQEAGIDMSGHAEGVIVFPSGSLKRMNNELQSLTKTETHLYTDSVIRADLDDQLSSIQFMIGIIMFVTIFAMSVSIGAIIMIAYSERNAEFGILFAIGYSKSDVRKMIYKEVGVLSAISAVAGYAVSMLLLFLLDIILFTPMGKPLAVYSAFGLIFTIVVPVMVFICAVYPILRRFKKTDLVAVIEGK